MVYLLNYEVKPDNDVRIQVADTDMHRVYIIDGEDNIKKAGKILGVKLVGSCLIYTLYNEELVKLLGIKQPVKLGMKFQYRNWEEVVYLPARNEEYEYTFRIGSREVNLHRNYLIMQGVKFDLTEGYKGLPRLEQEYPEERFIPEGYIPKAPGPTKDEIRAEANRRRLLQEREKVEREQRLKETVTRQREEARQQAAQQKLVAKQNMKAEANRRNADQVYKAMQQGKTESARPEARSAAREGARPAKRFRAITEQDRAVGFEIMAVYKGFKILRSYNGVDIAIIYVKSHDIYAKTLKSLVHPGESIVTPFNSLATCKRWINSEFY